MIHSLGMSHGSLNELGGEQAYNGGEYAKYRSCQQQEKAVCCFSSADKELGLGLGQKQEGEGNEAKGENESRSGVGRPGWLMAVFHERAGKRERQTRGSHRWRHGFQLASLDGDTMN